MMMTSKSFIALLSALVHCVRHAGRRVRDTLPAAITRLLVMKGQPIVPGIAAVRDRPGLAARAAAVSLLSSVLDGGKPLDAALESEPAFAALPVRDKALARAIVATALRRHGTIEAVLTRLIERPPRNAGRLTRILEVAAAQILFMEVADHAAVSLAVDQVSADREARRYKALANAVLRRMARERDGLLVDLDNPGVDTPAWLWARWSETYGSDTAAAIAAAHRVEPALDLTVKADPEAWAARLGGIVLPTGAVRLVPSGPVEGLAGFAEGEWWVQDAAAALSARLLGNVSGKRVADLCAAPGGKAAQLAHAGAHVTAVDISEQRLVRLRENLERLRLSAETVAADILAWQPAGLFDAVLLDAPCTATGTIRRHPDIPWLKRPSDVVALAALQARMIERAVGLLKPGGVLVYCTCSLEPEEGESHGPMLARLGLTPIPISASEVGGLAEALTPDGSVRTLPCHLPNAEPRLSGLDGFFITRHRKA
jgi:16S rRNA (cytosine967-C5)-methyltransferase